MESATATKPEAKEAKQPKAQSESPFTKGDRIIRTGQVKDVKENGGVVVHWDGRPAGSTSTYSRKRAEKDLRVQDK